MSWKVTWSRRAVKDMRNLDRQVAQRVYKAVGRLAETAHGDVRKLVDRGAERRLRVGDWRVRFDYNAETRTITVLRVLPRDKAYRQ